VQALRYPSPHNLAALPTTTLAGSLIDPRPFRWSRCGYPRLSAERIRSSSWSFWYHISPPPESLDSRHASSDALRAVGTHNEREGTLESFFRFKGDDYVYPTFHMAQRDCMLCARVFQAGREICAGAMAWSDAGARETDRDCGGAGDGLTGSVPCPQLSARPQSGRVIQLGGQSALARLVGDGVCVHRSPRDGGGASTSWHRNTTPVVGQRDCPDNACLVGPPCAADVIGKATHRCGPGTYTQRRLVSPTSATTQPGLPLRRVPIPE
jgi:hypothetical protein